MKQPIRMRIIATSINISNSTRIRLLPALSRLLAEQEQPFSKRETTSLYRKLAKITRHFYAFLHSLGQIARTRHSSSYLKQGVFWCGGGNNENRLACSNNELFEQALLANLSHTSLHPGKQFSKYRTTSVRFLFLNADRFE